MSNMERFDLIQAKIKEEQEFRLSLQKEIAKTDDRIQELLNESKRALNEEN